MASKKILVVEGDEAFAMMLSNTLEANSYQVFTSDNGDGAADTITREKPNLILLSVELSQGNGYLVCKQLKEDRNLRKYPIILMSAQATQEDFDKHRKLKVRAEDYLIKPFTDEDLLKKVENLVGFHISEEEYNSLQEQIAQILEEKITLEEKLRDRDGELAASRDRTRAAVKEADLLREKLESTERKVKEYSVRSQKAEDHAAQIEDRVRKLEAEKKRLDDERRRLKDVIAKAAGVLGDGR